MLNWRAVSIIAIAMLLFAIGCSGGNSLTAPVQDTEKAAALSTSHYM